MKYGILEHCGTKENDYPIVLSNDKDLHDWIAKLQGKGVYIGVQAEWIDWVGCFSKEVFSQLDYVLTDSWTVRDASGKRIKAFCARLRSRQRRRGVHEVVRRLDHRDPGDHAARHLVPSDVGDAEVHPQLEQMWTEERMRRVITTLKNTNTAVEIDSSVKLPTLPFLKMAKAEGVKFSFGASSQGARSTRSTGRLPPPRNSA